MSAEKLRILCHKETGRSPMAQVLYLRMRRAADLLADNILTVQEVGLAVGYENQFTFSRAFRRCYHLSPSAYRKQTHDGTTKF